MSFFKPHALDKQATEIANLLELLSQGKPLPDFAVPTHGPTTAIYMALNHLQQSLVRQKEEEIQVGQLAKGLKEMMSKHEDGWIDETIGITGLHGVYADIAHDINHLVKAHIDVKMKVVKVVSAYARGDFSTDMDRLPGKKAQITEAIDGVKTGLLEASTATKEANLALTRLAVGDTTQDMQGDYKGIFDHLKQNFNTVNSTIRNLITQLQYMSDEHNKGDIDVIMHTNAFAGDFKVMAQGVNEMVNGHITVKKKAMACIKAFGEGDFDAQLEKFPGKKAFINEIVEKVRNNLKEFIKQMQHMSEEHNRGDIDVVIPTNDFAGDFKVMAQGVNDMVNGHIAVKKKAMACIKEFGEGNFDAPLEAFPGKKAFINEIIEKVRSNLKEFIAQMQHMSDEHNEGDIDVVISTHDFNGDFRLMAQGVNDMVNGHINVKKQAMACIKAFGEGDFNAPLAQFPGKKAFINETIEQVRTNLKALIADTTHLAESAAEGDIEKRADAAKHAGDFRRIIEGINQTLETIVGPIVTVKTSADAVTTAAKEIAAGNADLSQRTEQQAASLEETASSMEELASTVKQNAENAKQASQLATVASTVAAKGGTVVSEVVSTMASINESSRKIVDIISVIDGIAFQTNILALNAAVEAARAGEQGRGFAVVAGEVRNLAQRSAAAAKEIKQLISNSVDKVEGGTKLVEQAGTTMEEIVTSVKRVTDIMAEIAAASVEQSTGIDQVNVAITQMDETTQQNAALVEEAAAAAESLEEQAQTMSDAVSMFNIGRSTAATPARVNHAAKLLKKPVKSNTSAVSSKAPLRKKSFAATGSSSPDSEDWEEF